MTEPEMCTSSWIAPGDESMRAKIVPMVADALRRTAMFGLEIIGWDYVIMPIPSPTGGIAVAIGVAISVRGYDLTGPGKELMHFRPFSTWRPTQAEVDGAVTGIIDGLREARAAQGANGR